jgi:hypothetical protein
MITGAATTTPITIPTAAIRPRIRRRTDVRQHQREARQPAPRSG